MTLKVLELFGGIGACTAAMKRLGIDFEVVDYVEIDKHAVASYNAINGTNFTPQDVTKWDKDIKVDFIMHGSPCQDFSLAGVQKGGDKGSGTRSSLMYETVRIVEKLRPKYVCWENVANLLSEKHFHNFANYINTLAELGYSSAYKVLNAKNYGIPQNRERVFTISVLDGASIDLFGHELDFHWPQPFPLEKRLKDLLEDNVSKKFYIPEKMLNYFMANAPKQIDDENDTERVLQIGNAIGTANRDNPQRGRVYEPQGIAPALNTMQGGNLQPFVIGGIGEKLSNKGSQWYQQNRVYDSRSVALCVDGSGIGTNYAIPIKNATEQGYLLAEEGDGVDISTRMEHHRGTVQKGMTQTLTTAGGAERGVVINDLRIRKLTPRECWRLMGRTDDDFEKAEKVCSNSQLYKQAGNSIVVDVLVYLFDELFRQYPTERNENG